jgi:hypothetical protein
MVIDSFFISARETTFAQIKILSTHQTSDNLNMLLPHFLKHARSVDRDAIWNVDDLRILLAPSSSSLLVLP